jgi:hypothetical protein
MACPYFLPQKRIENPPWPHPARLPLGDAWSGCCTAPGHDGVRPTDEELKDGCNLGYARHCARLPVSRAADAVRFSVARDRDHKLSVQFVCEIGYAPAAHGMLQFDAAAGRWSSEHADARIQKMAECYVETYLSRTGTASQIEMPRQNNGEARGTRKATRGRKIATDGRESQVS